MTRLLIAGAGGHGRVVADLAESTGRYAAIAFVDDRHPELTLSGEWPVVGSFDDIERLRDSFDAFAAALGDARVRLHTVDRASRSAFELQPLIHPDASISRQASLGPGTVICAGAVIGVGATLGRACIVNTSASVDHDCRLADAVHVAPGARLGGGVTVGARAWIGIGACVRQELTIGADAMVAAGAVCVTDVAAGATVMGVPAQAISNKRP